MLKHQWKHLWNETWDPALEPKIDRPAKIIDTYLTHQMAYMFAAKYVHLKAEQVNDAPLSENFKTLAGRIALLGNDDLDEFLPTLECCKVSRRDLLCVVR